MTDALIGYSGFVGGNLVRQHTFQRFFNTSNIGDIAGASFDLLVCSAVPAEKWKANKNPEADLANIQELSAQVRRARAGRLILISTIDVYPTPIDVDESTVFDAQQNHAYGRHRKWLEDTLAKQYDTLIVRLPGLFGAGLKKNAIYDMLHDSQLQMIDADDVFQFYHLDNLWRDIEIALTAKLEIINIATEPVSMREVAREAFDSSFDNRLDRPPVRYNMLTRHHDLYGGAQGYIQNRAQVLEYLKVFVMNYRST